MNRSELSHTFRELHTAGFLLPNAWDAASARIFEHAGFPAIGTTSAGIAYARGRLDGQTLTRSEMCSEVANIIRAVHMPVNADIEAGYGDTPTDVTLTVRAFLDIGAVGLNLEDATGLADAPLFTLEDQQRRIEAARHTADALGIPAYLNARTDTYITAFGNTAEERFAETVRRGRTYLSAGADSIFVPLVTDPAIIAALCAEVGGPITVMAFPSAPAVHELLGAGASRVSIGPSAMLAALGLVDRIARELRESGTYSAMQRNFYGFQEAEQLFSS